MIISYFLVFIGVILYISGSFVIEHNTIIYDGYSYPWPEGEDAYHHKKRLDRQRFWRYVGRGMNYIGTILSAIGGIEANHN